MDGKFSWPAYSDEEVAAAGMVLASGRVNYWTGTECREFEKEFAEWCGAAHAVALTNGTVALEAALEALDIGPGDEVVVTPRTFIASVSCVARAGAVPVFADIDPDSGNISADTIARVLSPRSKAVICVHLAGWPCDMDPIMALAADHGLKVIEDCAQAHGARYKGRSVGTIGHVGAWSFCQDKIMTTAGEGGMVTTNDHDLWEAMWSLKDHGKNWEAVHRRDTALGFRWLHESFGTNWRMLEVQAAIGRIQLRKMDDWHARRLAYAKRLWNAAGAMPGLRVPACPAEAEHGAYKCYVYLIPEMLADGWDRNRILGEINARAIPCFSGSCSEVYLEKAFEDTGWRPSDRLPVAKRLGETSLMFLVHPTLPESAIDRTAEVLKEVMALATSK